MVVKNVELPEYSVLMSVYAGEKPEHLRASIESMLSQTYVTNDFVLVCDGKLTKELDDYFDHMITGDAVDVSHLLSPHKAQGECWHRKMR